MAVTCKEEPVNFSSWDLSSVYSIVLTSDTNILHVLLCWHVSGEGEGPLSLELRTHHKYGCSLNRSQTAIDAQKHDRVNEQLPLFLSLRKSKVQIFKELWL